VPDQSVPGIINGHSPRRLSIWSISACIIRTEGEKGCQTRVFRVSEMGTNPRRLFIRSISACIIGTEGEKGCQTCVFRVSEMRTKHRRVSKWTILTLSSSSGLKGEKGYQTRLFRVSEMGTKPPPGINLDNLGIIFRTKGEKGYQTRAFRVSEMGTKPPPGINLDNLDCGNTSNIRFDIYIYVYITGHSDPAPTSAPSTGCVLLLSCG